MSRRRSKKQQQSRNQLVLRVRTEMLPDGRVEVDPIYNRLAIESLDALYERANTEDYDPGWEDEHKVAFFLYQIFDEILSRYEPERPDDENPMSAVPELSRMPVRDVVDIAKMPRGRSNLN